MEEVKVAGTDKHSASSINLVALFAHFGQEEAYLRENSELPWRPFV